jgi:uncharacterized protein
VKIVVDQIPPEGLSLAEEINPQAWDLDTEIIKFRSPVKIRARISRITNAVTAKLSLEAAMHSICSRCLEEFDIDFKKDIELNYLADNEVLAIDLDPDIREEIILDYPAKPLCKVDCRGLCPKCGKNLNKGGCSCGTT